MDPASIVFAATLPTALMAVPIFAIWSNNRRRIAELKYQAQARTADGDAYRELEERMRILERIVTDKGYDVASQIEALRDDPRLLAADAERN